jgi:hypothetical protein
MTLVCWMVGGSLLSWLAAVALLGRTAGLEVFWGMIAPLIVASATWVLMRKTHRKHPERVTSLMILAFAGKMVFFGAYVALALTMFPLRPVPFVISFTSYFIALHVTEAIWLRRLFQGERPRPAITEA